jgi:hypothetical protein
MSHLFIVLDAYNWQEAQSHRELSHDGGRLLMWLTDSLSLQRGKHWTHSYCFRDQKKFVPTVKEERKRYLTDAMARLHSEMEEARRRFGALVVVGLGKLSCECLLDATDLNAKAGTYWKNVRRMWFDIVTDRIWIANSTDAALFDPVLIVEITRVLAKAAEQAGIEIRLRGPDELPVFDWSKYL